MQEFLRDDNLYGERALTEALDVMLPQLASRFLDLARDAARTGSDPDVDGSLSNDGDVVQNCTIKLRDIQARRPDIERLAERYGASNVRVFGFAARGDAKPYSDIDFLVDGEPGRSMLDLGGLQMSLQKLFERPVDVAFPRAGTFRVRATAEAVSL